MISCLVNELGLLRPSWSVAATQRSKASEVSAMEAVHPGHVAESAVVPGDLQYVWDLIKSKLGSRARPYVDVEDILHLSTPFKLESCPFSVCFRVLHWALLYLWVPRLSRGGQLSCFFWQRLRS